MSNQGYEGWFPECLLCGAGNVGGIVCLDPTRHDYGYAGQPYEIKPITVTDERLVKEDGHWWKCCQICDRRVHADPAAFGSYALCVDCFNEYARRGEYPPTSPSEMLLKANASEEMP